MTRGRTHGIHDGPGTRQISSHFPFDWNRVIGCAPVSSVTTWQDTCSGEYALRTTICSAEPGKKRSHRRKSSAWDTYPIVGSVSSYDSKKPPKISASGCLLSRYADARSPIQIISR